MVKKVRALVARMADDAESGFAKGSIRWVTGYDIPVTREFKHEAAVGTARLSVEEEQVYADLTLTIDPTGLYPALGGTAHSFRTNTEGSNRIVTSFSVLQIGLSETPNADPQIPAIAAPVEPGLTDAMD